MGTYSEFGPCPGHCTEFKGALKNNNQTNPSIDFTWTDPESEGVPYGGTVLTVKEDSIPISYIDGDVVINTMDKNAYNTTPVSYDIPYNPGTKKLYAALFPYSSSSAFNNLTKNVLEFDITIAEKQQKFKQVSRIPVTGALAGQSTGSVINGKYVFGQKHNTDSKFKLFELDPVTGVISIKALLPEGSTFDLPDYNSFDKIGSVIEWNSAIYIAVTYKRVSSGKTYYDGVCVLKYDGTTFTKVYGYNDRSLSTNNNTSQAIVLVPFKDSLYLGTYLPDYRLFKIEKDGSAKKLAASGNIEFSYRYRVTDTGIIFYTSNYDIKYYDINLTSADAVGSSVSIPSGELCDDLHICVINDKMYSNKATKFYLHDFTTKVSLPASDDVVPLFSSSNLYVDGETVYIFGGESDAGKSFLSAYRLESL